MKKVIIVLTMLFTIGIVLLSGCTNTSVDVYDDDNFHNQWIIPAVTNVLDSGEEAIEAYENEDWERFRIACENLEENTLPLLDEIKQYSVSTAYKTIWTEFNSALEEFEKGSNIGKGKTEDTVEKAYEYLVSGNNRCKTVLELLKEMDE